MTVFLEKSRKFGVTPLLSAPGVTTRSDATDHNTIIHKHICLRHFGRFKKVTEFHKKCSKINVFISCLLKIGVAVEIVMFYQLIPCHSSKQWSCRPHPHFLQHFFVFLRHTPHRLCVGRAL